MHSFHVWSSIFLCFVEFGGGSYCFNVVESFDSSKNENKKEACCLLFKELPSVFDISAIRGPSTEQLESFLGFLNNNYRVSWYKAVL